MSISYISPRDLILVVTPIFIANLWIWYRGKKNKKRSIVAFRDISFLEMMTIESRVISQIQSLRKNIQEYGYSVQYLNVIPFDLTTNKLPIERLLDAFVNNSKLQTKTSKHMDAMTLYSHCTQLIDNQMALILTSQQLRKFGENAMSSIDAFHNRLSETFERIVRETQLFTSNPDRANEIYELLNAINCKLDQEIVEHHIKSLETLLSSIKDEPTSLNLYMELRMLQNIMSDYHNHNRLVEKRLLSTIDDLEQFKAQIREAKDFLQSQTKIKKFWNLI